MIDKVIRAKLIAIRQSTYTMYVFQNLDNGEYIMCTRLPNWQVPDIDIGVEGFLNYQIVKAGEQYFDPISETNVCYKYSNIYFINFINKDEGITSKSIII